MSDKHCDAKKHDTNICGTVEVCADCWRERGPTRETVTPAEAYRLLFSWGEARSKTGRAKTDEEKLAAITAETEARLELAEAADELWTEWLGEMGR